MKSEKQQSLITKQFGVLVKRKDGKLQLRSNSLDYYPVYENDGILLRHHPNMILYDEILDIDKYEYRGQLCELVKIILESMRISHCFGQ